VLGIYASIVKVNVTKNSLMLYYKSKSP